jgi:hypothetical protein
MHSAGMSRRASRLSTTDMPYCPRNIGTKRMGKRLTAFLRAHGDIDTSPTGRVWALYIKVRRGDITGGLKAKIVRDHCHKFAEWDKQGAFEKFQKDHQQ